MTSGAHQQNQSGQNGSSTAQPHDAAATERVAPGSALPKFLFAFTNRHRGKALELDATDDTLRVLGPAGEQLAVVNSEVALDQLLGHNQPTTDRLGREPDPLVDMGRPRPLPFRVTAQSRDGRTYEGTCQCLWERSLFVELTALPTPGTSLHLVLIPPGEPDRGRRVAGIVAWACPRPDEFGCGQGVGVALVGGPPEPAVPLAERGRQPERKRAAAQASRTSVETA